MRIIIAGAGEVGYHLAELLSTDDQDIYLIDQDEERLQHVQNRLDVITITGDAKSFSILKTAKVDGCDLLIAVTSSEEANFYVCALGKKLGAKTTIARFSNTEIHDPKNRAVFKDMGIDTIVSPTELASNEIERLIQHSAFTDSFDFEDGRLSVFGIAVDGDSPVVNHKVRDTDLLSPGFIYKPIAIQRQNKTLIAKGDTVIRTKDIVYFITDKEHTNDVLNICGKNCFDIETVMILGGSRIGLLTAQMLEKKYKVTIIEQDRKRSEELAQMLNNTLVLNFDGRDIDTLLEEGLSDMDAFIAATNDSETNIITSLMAKSHGVKKAIARVENIDYFNITHNIGIDTLINKKVIAASEIFRHVRQGDVSAIANLHGVDGEIIEFIVKAGSKVTKRPIKKLGFPDDAHIAGVMRNDKAHFPLGDFEIQAGDKVIVFSLNDAIHKAERFFV